MKVKSEKRNMGMWAGALLLAITVLTPILFFIYCPDNLMHSDMSAEVILSKLLASEGRLVSPNWFYSTEIRIVYSQLIMTPLFMIFPAKGMHMIKLASIIIYMFLLLLAYLFTAKEFDIKKTALFLSGALLFAPLSNEYFDMVLIGCFYTSQLIVTYLLIKLFVRDIPEKLAVKALVLFILLASSFTVGLSGMRYLASLFAPLFLAVIIQMILDKEKGTLKDIRTRAFISFGMGVFATIGCAINLFVLPKFYHFDDSGNVSIVPLGEVPERFITSIKLMLRLLGFREGETLLGAAGTGYGQMGFGDGLVNVIKAAALIFLLYVVIYLFKNRYKVLGPKQRMLLYYFICSFFINWIMLIFTDVLMQYRYWIPSLSIAILLVGIYLSVLGNDRKILRLIPVAVIVLTVLSSYYGELLKDYKYNDCAKRYAYMDFLEKEGYEFGYATFWNASVTEYLSDGKIHVGNLGGDENGSAPYEWLTPTYYYQKGYHEGKTFLLLDVTEEPALKNGDITFMQDAPKVYEDERYVIYEGEGMYLFSNP